MNNMIEAITSVTIPQHYFVVFVYLFVCFFIMPGNHLLQWSIIYHY